MQQLFSNEREFLELADKCERRSRGQGLSGDRELLMEASIAIRALMTVLMDGKDATDGSDVDDAARDRAMASPLPVSPPAADVGSDPKNLARGKSEPTPTTDSDAGAAPSGLDPNPLPPATVATAAAAPKSKKPSKGRSGSASH
jgi:hypothetical protein